MPPSLAWRLTKLCLQSVIHVTRSLSGVREEGASGGFGEVAGAGRLDQASGSSLLRRSGAGLGDHLDAGSPLRLGPAGSLIAKPGSILRAGRQ